MHFKFQLLCHSEQGFKTKPSINVTENLLFVFRGMIQQLVIPSCVINRGSVSEHLK